MTDTAETEPAGEISHLTYRGPFKKGFIPFPDGGRTVEFTRGQTIGFTVDELEHLDTDWEGERVGLPATEPPNGTVAEVLAWVDGDPDRARQALDAEQAGKSRTSLLEQLAQITETGAAGTQKEN